MIKEIKFNKPLFIGDEKKYINKSLGSQNISGNGYNTKMCIKKLSNLFNIKYGLMTPSCTHSLEMAALCIEIEKGDEIIMPSFTFVSTANAFALRGAVIKFVDINPNTMNIDEELIIPAITSKTKAIVVVHYAGVAVNMDKIKAIAKNFNLIVVEDAAQAINSFYKNKPLGTLGDIGCYSFHETKNLTSAGEGGFFITKNKFIMNKAEIIQEKGTNRRSFFNGNVKKYKWMSLGSSYLINDISAAYLYPQLLNIDKITKKRLMIWNLYFKKLFPLQQKKFLNLPFIPKYCTHNGHIFYIKLENSKVRDKLKKYLLENRIHSVTHYEPLHSSKAGKVFGKFIGKDNYTTIESEKLLRLPMSYHLNVNEVNIIASKIFNFFIN